MFTKALPISIEYFQDKLQHHKSLKMQLIQLNKIPTILPTDFLMILFFERSCVKFPISDLSHLHLFYSTYQILNFSEELCLQNFAETQRYTTCHTNLNYLFSHNEMHSAFH